MKKTVHQPNTVTFNSLIDCSVRCNKIETAERLFKEMKTSSETKPDLITYSTLIKGFCKERNMNAAFKIFTEMKSTGIVADEVLFNSLLDGCFKSNELDHAFRI